MNLSSRYFISLLSSFIKDTVPKKPSSFVAENRGENNDKAVDWEKIYQLACIHSLGGIVYLAVQKLEEADRPEISIINKLKSDFFYTTFRFEEQQKAFSEIVELLNREKIRHLIFKGTVIHQYYPVKQMRTQGDIDFLVHSEDLENVRGIFAGLGYKNHSTKWHDKFKKGKLIFECHEKLINNEINSKVDYAEYFKNAWQYAKNTGEGYTFELDINYHLAFLIVHIAKHFYEKGAGVRLILDIAIILDKFGDTLDFQEIWRHLETVKLDLFAKNIFALCERWFGVKTPGMNYKMDELTYNAMSKYILEGGTFGYSNNNIAIGALRKELSKSENVRFIKFKALLRKIFLDFDIMREKYPILKKHPYLWGFAWIHRAIKCIVVTRKRTIRILKGIRECSEEGQNTLVMMRKIGL